MKTQALAFALLLAGPAAVLADQAQVIALVQAAEADLRLGPSSFENVPVLAAFDWVKVSEP